MIGSFPSDGFISEKLVGLLLNNFFSCSKNQERFLKEFPRWKHHRIHFQKVIQGSTLAKVVESNSLARRKLVEECVKDNLLLREISSIREPKLNLEKKRVTKKNVGKVLSCHASVDVLWEIIAGRVEASQEAKREIMSRAEVDLVRDCVLNGNNKVKKSSRQKRIEDEARLVKKLEKANQKLEARMKLVCQKNVKLQEELKQEKVKTSNLEAALQQIEEERTNLRKYVNELERRLRTQEKQIQEYKRKIKEKKKVIKKLESKCEACPHKNKTAAHFSSSFFTKDATQLKGSSQVDLNRENKFMEELKKELANEEAKKQLKRAQSRLRWLEQEFFEHGHPQRIIIDGHNLLLKGGYINSGECSFEPSARERLIKNTHEAALRLNCRTILVFDTKFNVSFAPNGFLDVVYWPKKDGGADRYILNEVSALNNDLVLVFSDDQHHIGREVERLRFEGRKVYCLEVELMCNYLAALEKLKKLEGINGFDIQKSI